MVKLIGLVERHEVPVRNSGKVPNPELVPIIEEILKQLDTGKFVKVEVADKKESERIRESLRGQLRNRGLNCTTASDSKMVRTKLRDSHGKRTGEIGDRLKFYVFAAAYTKDVGTETNGKVEEPDEVATAPAPKSKRSHAKKQVADAEG